LGEKGRKNLRKKITPFAIDHQKQPRSSARSREEGLNKEEGKKKKKKFFSG